MLASCMHQQQMRRPRSSPHSQAVGVPSEAINFEKAAAIMLVF